MLMLPPRGVSMILNATFNPPLNPPEIPVKEKFPDEPGGGLPGVNILVKGTANGTTTDAKGEFVINAPEDGVLVFSFIGYSTQEISVGSRSTIEVRLLADTHLLSEVV